MKRLIAAAAGVAAIVLGIVIVRTLMVASPSQMGEAAPVSSAEASQIAGHLSEALRFQTVSYDGGLHEAEKNAQLDAMRGWLETTYPNFHRATTREVVGRSLLFTWAGKDAAAPAVLLMAHMDVVPVVPGTERDWTHAPFAGDVADGHVWGRGAIDDKGSLVCLLEAAERLAASGFTPARTVLFAMGEDEESGGSRGNLLIARQLQARGVHLAWILDEGGAIVRRPLAGIAGSVAFVAVAEKGYMSLQLVAHGQGGHSSLPSADLAIPRLAKALTAVGDHPFASGLDDTQRHKLAIIAPLTPIGTRLLLANLWLTSPLVVRQSARTPEGAARLHTTIAPTMLSAGVKENVLPQTATAVVNFRLHPRDTIESATAHVREAVNDPLVDITVLPEIRSEASRVSDTRGPAYAYLSEAIGSAFGHPPIAPDIMTGASDSRHYLPMAGDVFRLFPVSLELSDLPRIHGTNERVAVADLGPATAFFTRLIDHLDGYRDPVEK